MQVSITVNGGTRKELNLDTVRPGFEFIEPIIAALKEMDRSKSIYFPHMAGGLREAQAFVDLKYVDNWAAGVITFKDQKAEMRQAYHVEVKQTNSGTYFLRYRMGVKHNKGLHPSGTEECFTVEDTIESFVRNYMVGAPFRKVVPT